MKIVVTAYATNSVQIRIGRKSCSLYRFDILNCQDSSDLTRLICESMYANGIDPDSLSNEEWAALKRDVKARAKEAKP